MKKLFFLISIYLFCGSKLFSQAENSLLWEISGNGLKKTSYLYGTIHAICPADFAMNESTKKTFESTEQVYLELDYDSPKMMSEIQQNLALTDGTTIANYLSIKDYELLDTFFKTNLGVGLKVFGFMKPLGYQSMLYMTFLNCQPKSYEEEFAMMAKKSKKEVLGLESVAQQMAIFDKIPVQQQVNAIMESVKDEEKSKKELKNMITAYTSNDLTKLTEVMTSTDWGAYKGYENDLLYARNADWLKQLAPILPAKSTFVAVGAGHLGGEKSLVQLLQKAGYTVKAVK